MTMVQGTFDDLGTPLSSVTFVVVDLETTGGSPAECGITEIGAVKVRGGEVVGELQTLVNPGAPIPSFISVLTGITDAMVAGAPRIEAALPAFLEFAAGSVLVAHNAGFDISFLKAAARRTEPRVARLPGARHRAPRPPARAPRRGAQPPARHPRPPLPGHDDARPPRPPRRPGDRRRPARPPRAGRLARASTPSRSSSTTPRASLPPRRRKRHLADDLPDAPGVYLFKDGQGHVLYVGTSVSIRTRVRSYFTASEHRRRMGEMVRIAESVSPIVCATTLEAEVRELRLIAQHKPRYNRRSRNPEKALWVKLTVEPFPRLSIVRTVAEDGARYAGPFGSRSAAEAAVAAVHEVLPLRQCLERLSPTRPRSACALADMGRCGAPCTGAQSVDDYAAVVDRAAELLAGDTRDLLTALRERMATLSAAERFEDAQVVRERLVALVRGTSRSQRLDPLARIPQLVAARRSAPRRLGGRLRPPRSPRRQHHVTARRRPDALHRGALRERRGRRGRPRRRCRPRRPRRARRCCAGSSPPGCASSRSTARGPARSAVPRPVRAELEPLETARREVAGFAGVR